MPDPIPESTISTNHPINECLGDLDLSEVRSEIVKAAKTENTNLVSGGAAEEIIYNSNSNPLAITLYKNAQRFSQSCAPIADLVMEHLPEAAFSSPFGGGALSLLLAVQPTTAEDGRPAYTPAQANLLSAIIAHDPRAASSLIEWNCVFHNDLNAATARRLGYPSDGFVSVSTLDPDLSEERFQNLGDKIENYSESTGEVDTFSFKDPYVEENFNTLQNLGYFPSPGEGPYEVVYDGLKIKIFSDHSIQLADESWSYHFNKEGRVFWRVGHIAVGIRVIEEDPSTPKTSQLKIIDSRFSDTPMSPTEWRSKQGFDEAVLVAGPDGQAPTIIDDLLSALTPDQRKALEALKTLVGLSMLSSEEANDIFFSIDSDTNKLWPTKKWNSFSISGPLAGKDGPLTTYFSDCDNGMNEPCQEREEVVLNALQNPQKLEGFLKYIHDNPTPYRPGLAINTY